MHRVNGYYMHRVNGYYMYTHVNWSLKAVQYIHIVTSLQYLSANKMKK
jgi:hypothetical protein